KVDRSLVAWNSATGRKFQPGRRSSSLGALRMAFRTSADCGFAISGTVEPVITSSADTSTRPNSSRPARKDFSSKNGPHTCTYPDGGLHLRNVTSEIEYLGSIGKIHLRSLTKVTACRSPAAKLASRQ